MRLPWLPVLVAVISNAAFADAVIWQLPNAPDDPVIVKSPVALVGASLSVWPAGGSADFAMVGRTALTEDTLAFTPDFPFVRGVTYRALVDGQSVGHETVAFRLESTQGESPRVLKVYPSGASLPANALRLYVEFSHPMARGTVAQQVRLLDDAGTTLESAFLDLRQELWDPAQRRLTLLLDPGRTKRGAGPNRVLGTPLSAGTHVVLEIGADAQAADGQRLAQSYRQRFQITPAARHRLEVSQWDVAVPSVGSRDALNIVFPQALDLGLVERGLALVNADGMPVAGSAQVGAAERSWIFRPTSPWRSGDYRIRVAPFLEDAAGNTPLAPFDDSDVHRSGISRQVVPGIRFRIADN